MKNAAKSKIEEQISNISRQPGVYLFKNASNNVIYIGKAKNLRNRVRSYFQSSRSADTRITNEPIL